LSRSSLSSLTSRFSNMLGYAVLRFVSAFLGLLGLERASALMGWCWRTFAPKTKRHPRAHSQLEAALPELTPHERDDILRAMWDNLGRTFAEGMLLDRLLAEPDRIVVENEVLAAELHRPNDTIRGTIFVSMHSGNWEALGVPLAERGMRVAALYQAVQNPMLERYLLAQREKLYRAGMISKGSHAMKRIVRLLRSGDAVGMLADHRQAGRGIMVPFFGQDAPSTPLPATLALRTGARLVLTRCRRVGPVRFTIDLKEILADPTDDHDKDVGRITGAIQAQFEAWIRERPQEWMWAHRRWSREVRQPRRDPSAHG
jgi:Kdo2-lipid IVA lauroyltransferase/acyltransferase